MAHFVVVTTAFALFALTGGRRLAEPGSAPGLAARPWGLGLARPAPMLPRREFRDFAEAQQTALHGGEGGVSDYFAELLGLDEEELLAPDALEGDEDDSREILSRPVSDLLGLVDFDDLEGDEDGSNDLALPPQLVELLGIRGGETTELATPLLQQIWPLIKRADFPMRVALLSWAVYDKTRRILKHLVPKPFQEECEEFLRTVAGVELQALEAMRQMLENAKDLGNHDSPKVREAHAAALNYLAAEMKIGVAESVDYALSVGKETFEKLREKERAGVAVHHVALRIADAVKPGKDGKLRPLGKYIDLRSKALSKVAEIDVTHELVPEHVTNKTRIKLLGLVASLGHESVFHKVQEALWQNETHGRLMTISDFNKKMGVDSAADLVKKLIHKYSTRKDIFHIFLTVYTIVPLRDDPQYFQICWGIRLLSHIAASNFENLVVKAVARRGMGMFSLVEVQYRSTQLLRLLRLARSGIKLNKFQRLIATNCFLTLLVFGLDKPYRMLLA